MKVKIFAELKQGYRKTMEIEETKEIEPSFERLLENEFDIEIR